MGAAGGGEVGRVSRSERASKESTLVLLLRSSDTSEELMSCSSCPCLGFLDNTSRYRRGPSEDTVTARGCGVGPRAQATEASRPPRW